MPLIALVFHTEKLHADRAWRRAEKVAHSAARRGCQVTFFIYPFRAQVAGVDISERVRVLAALGHEIAQHTHFYAGTKIDKPDKVNDLSKENIARCLQRDFETLCDMGFRPYGFTAGGWMVNGTVLDALVDMGFAYDCSARVPADVDANGLDASQWLRSPLVYTNERGSLLCLPTTCSLGQWFRSGSKNRGWGVPPYQLVYLHDYDLLSARTWLMLRAFLTVATRRCRFVSSQMLAEQIRIRE